MFSIVVPVYNVEKYLDKCIESILSQTYQDFELILVDDGSTDNSGVICDKYQAANQEKIKVIHRSNEGLLSARIAGLHETKGTYIYNADSDDILSVNLLEHVKASIDESLADVIVFSAIRIDTAGNQLNDYARHFFTEGNVNLYDYWFEWVSTTILNPVWMKVIKRDLFDQQFDIKIKDFFNIQIGEDWLYSIFAICNASSIFFLDKALYYYRINPQSLTQNYKKREHLILQSELSIFFKALNFHGFDDPTIHKRLYDFYLKRIWYYVYRAASTNQLSNFEKSRIFKEIRSYESVQQVYEYLKSANINVLCKHGLAIFYKTTDKNKAVLCTFSSIYNMICKIKFLFSIFISKIFRS